MFSNIPGNDAIKRYLSLALEKGMFGNSLLFAGPLSANKEQFATAFASEIICRGDHADRHRRKFVSGNHPDFHVYRPEGKTGMHSIQAMRQLSEEVYLPPYESEYKVFILHDADRMQSYSANALLKTFEEPSLDTVIILISSAPELLISTIRSRCRALHFVPMAQESEGEDPLKQAALTLLCGEKFATYNELSAQAKSLAEIIESRSKLSEEALRAELLHGYIDKPNAQQRESIDKEIEGALAMQTTREAKQLFDTILAWHRDLLLMSVGGDMRFLILPNAVESLQVALKSNRQIALSHVVKAIEDAKLALARSTALNLCIENLLLRLDFIMD